MRSREGDGCHCESFMLCVESRKFHLLTAYGFFLALVRVRYLVALSFISEDRDESVLEPGNTLNLKRMVCDIHPLYHKGYIGGKYVPGNCTHVPPKDYSVTDLNAEKRA